MIEDNPDSKIEQEIIALREQYLQLNQELTTSKKQLQKKKISRTEIFIIAKFLIVILVGINAQTGNIQFSGENISPMVEILTSRDF